MNARVVGILVGVVALVVLVALARSPGEVEVEGPLSASPEAAAGTGAANNPATNRPTAEPDAARVAEDDAVGSAPGQAEAAPAEPGAQAPRANGAVAAPERGLAEAPEELGVPDERGRIAGTDLPTREQTPAFQQFVAQMDTAHRAMLEGIEDCVEQAPSLRGQALAVTVRRFDSGAPPAVKVEGAELSPEAQRCFERKAEATELPMPYQAQTIEDGAYTIVADTAAEFEWAFPVTP